MNTSRATVQWRKSSHSGAESNCVEVAPVPAGTAVRDSKRPAAPSVAFTANPWATFVAGLAAGTPTP